MSKKIAQIVITVACSLNLVSAFAEEVPEKEEIVVNLPEDVQVENVSTDCGCSR